jgi:hypothetical protein
MASIVLRNIRCIDYLAYGSIFTRAMFRPKKKLDVFFFARKAVDACREVVFREPFFNGTSSGWYEAPIEMGSRRSTY